MAEVKDRAIINVTRVVREATLKALTIRLQGTLQNGELRHTINAYAGVQAGKLTEKWLVKNQKKLQKLITEECRKQLKIHHAKTLRNLMTNLPSWVRDCIFDY